MTHYSLPLPPLLYPPSPYTPSSHPPRTFPRRKRSWKSSICEILCPLIVALVVRCCFGFAAMLFMPLPAHALPFRRFITQTNTRALATDLAFHQRPGMSFVAPRYFPPQMPYRSPNLTCTRWAMREHRVRVPHKCPTVIPTANPRPCPHPLGRCASRTASSPTFPPNSTTRLWPLTRSTLP